MVTEPWVPVTAVPTLAPFFFNDTATSEIYSLSLPDALPIFSTLPVALLPGVPLAVPPASVASPVSATATGASSAPWMVIVSVVEEVSRAEARRVGKERRSRGWPDHQKKCSAAALVLMT